MLKRSLAALSTLMLAGCSLVGDRSSYEEPPYQVLERLSDNVEVRRYGPRLVADVAMPEGNSQDDAGDKAFRILFDYISGKNKADGEVAMTVPVEMARGGTDSGEKVSMTTPVEQSTAAGGEGMRMRFFFPKKYTKETAPMPIDDRIEISELPGQTMMVNRYSGFDSDASRQEETAELNQILTASQRWQPAGPVVTMSYDPPWTLPFFRRLEVAREVTEQ